MWFGVSTPLVFAGAVFGARRPIIDHPVRTHQIPRQIPDQPWYLELHISMLVGGLMPFAVIFIELFFIFKSIWSDQYYYMFGFLTLVFLILVLTTVEIAIVITYFSLCSEVILMVDGGSWHWQHAHIHVIRRTIDGGGNHLQFLQLRVFMYSCKCWFDFSVHG